jgi:hypothetical protein
MSCELTRTVKVVHGSRNHDAVASDRLMVNPQGAVSDQLVPDGLRTQGYARWRSENPNDISTTAGLRNWGCITM